MYHQKFAYRAYRSKTTPSSPSTKKIGFLKNSMEVHGLFQKTGKSDLGEMFFRCNPPPFPHSKSLHSKIGFYLCQREGWVVCIKTPVIILD
jgi:hypothetical protein